MLRGIVFCAGCGAAMYRSYAYEGRPRSYVCRNRLETTGACSKPPIPAELLEAHVLNHLGSFVGSVEAWITERLVSERRGGGPRQRQLDAEKAQLAALDEQRQQRMAELTKIGITSLGLGGRRADRPGA